MRLRPWSHAPRDSKSSGRRQTIGIVIDNLVDGYQRILFDSIARSAREQSVNVVAFTGGRLPSTLFDLIGPENVDALIVVGSTIAHQVGPAGVAEFCARHAPLPICSIGIGVDGVPSVTITGSSGVRALVTHLMTEHGRRNLAFIRGLGADGAERYEAFKTCLNEFGVPLRDSLIVQGEFTAESGRKAIRVLCDERRVSFDGVVAADDYMALGAIDALEERGFAVPKDVAVVGFDDIEEARNAVVPLTTVQQPIRELGRRAVGVILKQLAKRDPGAIEPIICHPVKRRSCGCVVETPFTRRPSNLAQEFSSTEDALAARRDLVLADMLRTAQGELGSVGYHWEERLFNGITDELRGASGNPFLSANEELARRVFRSSGDVSTWQRVLSALRHHVLDCVGSNQQLRSVAENAFHDAFLVSANVVGREQNHRRIRLEQTLRAVIRTSNELVVSEDRNRFGPVVMQHLAALDVPSCYVSLYADKSRQQARLVLGYDAQLDVTERETASVFEVRRLAPEGSLPPDRSWVYALLPLEHQDELLGFALFEYLEQDTILFEVLRDQMGGALHAAMQ
jgi:DNA-binding LacI/PurR family transcriptional regulator